MAKTPLAIYVHWPYCARICPYCDFNVYKQKTDETLLGAICQDLKGWREWSGPREIISVHFGGGTPSLMTGADIAAILNTIDDLWGLPEGAEIGLEANPNNAATAKLDAFKAAGINRLSLGVQSFHDVALKQLGRDHDGAAARTAITAAVERFPSISADLIFGWHGQTEELLRADIQALLDLKVSHISTYQLTIEDGTAFAKAEARGDVQAVNDDQSADFYDLVRGQLSGAGFEHYEISNFAKQGHRSQHNLAYWRGLDYVGAGPGAHGRLTVDGQRFATIAALRPDDYSSRVKAKGLGAQNKEALSEEDRFDEYVLMGLRITDGLDLAKLAAPVDFMTRAQELIQTGHLEQTDTRLRATIKGRPLLNYITEKLLVG